MNMKDMIQRMTDIENPSKKQLMEACGGSMPAPEANPGTPVSINVSLNASGKEHVQDLINMMKNAGMGGAQPVSPAMMPMRLDMEKFRDAVDDSAGMPGEGADNMPREQYMDTDEMMAGGDDIHAEKDPADIRVKDASAFEHESYANEPDEKYDDHNTMLKDLSGGLNGQKKMFKKAQDGDNPMAVENIKEKLYALLAEKKAKPDFLDIDGDGDRKEPMKKAAADKKAAGGNSKGSDSKGLSAKQKKLPPGLQKAIAKKKVDETQLDELSSDTMKSYQDKTAKDMYKTVPQSGSSMSQKDRDAAQRKSNNRTDGRNRSDAKILSKDLDKEFGEGFDDMYKAAEKRNAEKGTGKFDAKKTTTGTVYTRKASTYDDGGKDSDMKKADKKVQK